MGMPFILEETPMEVILIWKALSINTTLLWSYATWQLKALPHRGNLFVEKSIYLETDSVGVT